MSGHNEFEGIEYADINKDVERTLTTFSRGYCIALAVSGLLVLYGAVVYYFQSSIGLGMWATRESIYWGLDLPTFIFWVGFSLSGTLLSGILLLTKSHWRNPIYRAAEMATGFALIVACIIIICHMGRPWRFWFTLPVTSFRLMWLNFRSPLTLDVIGLMSYLTASILFLFVGSIPDFAALRDTMSGWRKKLYTILSLGWRGTVEQWRHFRRAYVLIACCIIPVAVSMHTVTSFVPNMTTMPGSHSTIYPFYFVTGALLSGVSGVIMILVLVRKYLKLEKYLKLQYFDNLSKLVLLASMGISYIYLIELFVPWIKKANFELMPAVAKIRGPYAWIFWTMVILNSIVPLSLFMRKIRTNLTALFCIAVGIEIAMYFERYLMCIPSLAIGYLPTTWFDYAPNWAEYSILLWSVSIFVFVYLLAIKIIPVISIFEVKELLPFPKRGGHLKESKALENNNQKEPVTLTNGGSPIVIMGGFQYHDDAILALKELKEAGIRELNVHCPVPSDEIDSLLDSEEPRFSLKPSYLIAKLRTRRIHVIRFAAAGGIIFAILGVAMSAGSMLLYPIKTGPFEIVTWPTVVFSAGLLGALGGLIGATVGLIYLARMPSDLKGYNRKASLDRFNITVADKEPSNLKKALNIFNKYNVEVITGEN
ncbi:MAG: DUF3341 domain-containing protein [Actinobacteria bacterium]|nr:MAG: DUF3341 domain-containing protein [Actinomycetota bacterium]